MVSQLDELFTHLGTGRWTVLHFITTAYSAVFVAPLTLGGVFLAPRQEFYCRVPATNLSFLALHANTSHSFTSGGECEYVIDTPEGEVMEDCVEFDFDNSTFHSTFTSEYQLVCGRAFLQTSFQSMYMFGALVGAPFNGYLSDKYGRKFAVTLGYISYLALGLGSAWLPDLSCILVARFLLGSLHFVNSYTTLVLLLEVIEPKLRTPVVFMESNMWAFSTMLYGGFGYWIRDWRLLQTVVTLPGLLILPTLWLIDESPRWLIVNGRPQEALRVLTKAARWHGVELPPEAEMKKLVEEQASEGQTTQQHSSLWLIIKSFIDDLLVLFKTPKLRICTLSIYLNYLVVGMVYYGITLGGVSLSNDPFMYMVLNGIVELPAYNLTVPIVQRFGSKHTISVFFAISAIVLLTLAVTPAVYSITVLVLALVGKVAITTSFQTLIFYSNEFFPTEVRGRGVNGSAMMSRIGSVLSPFITDMVGTVYPWAPFAVFGSSALLAGTMTLMLPETRGQVLPDTMAQLDERDRKTTKTLIGDESVSTSQV